MLQLSLLAPDIDWKPPNMSELPSWADAKMVSMDLETRDKAMSEGYGSGCVWPDSYIIGISFCVDGDRPYYLPFKHYAGGNLQEEKVKEYIRDQAKNFKGELVGANLQYDLGYLLNEGIWFNNVSWFRDVLIADPLIYELHDSYSLDAVSKRYGLKGKEEEILSYTAKLHKLDPKKDMWKLNSKYVGHYAEQDALLTLQTYKKQLPFIEREKLWNVFNLESKVLPVLTNMRARGVRIDINKLDTIENWSREQEKNCLDEIKMRTGITLNLGQVWEKPPLAKILESIGINLEKTKTGQPLIDKKALENIDHPVAEALNRARKVNKLRTTFVKSIRERLINGRIHTTFNQLARENDAGDGIAGARWGRMSSEQPNLQQQPSRDDFASMWRSIYIADEGKLWASLDYSQQEPRMLVHFAALCNLRKAQEALENYINNPDADNHQMMADMTGLPRKQAKELLLGTCYGMGGAKLCRALKLPSKMIRMRNGNLLEVAGDEGQEIIDQFNIKLPFVKELAQLTQLKASKVGFIKTIAGRKCHFPKNAAGEFDWTHKALNRLIQGSSADQTKMAMVALEEAGCELQLQVHDEVNWSVDCIEEAKLASEIMADCAKLSLKFKVDVEVGPSWGEVV